jgi:predicted transcriptional regulator YdeE
MKKVQIEGFQVIGIAVRTTNENNQAKQDIGFLWHKLMSENIITKIPNIIDETIYAIYTDYESDHTKPYTTILGYKVSSLNDIPDGMIGKKIESATYTKFVAKGDLTDNAVIDVWNEIWNIDIDRTYQSDFETYGEKAIDPKNGEADIFISVI